MRLRKIISRVFLILLSLSFLASLPQSLFIPKVKAQYENITYDGVNNIVTFNQDSSTLDEDWYQADLNNPLTLLTSTSRFMTWSKEFSPSTWLNETTETNNSTMDDMTLVPINTGTPTFDAYYWGNTDRTFNTITLNVTTAGAGTWTLTWERSTGTSTWGTITVTDNTNRFRTAGVNTITFTSVPAVKGTVNGVSAYWVRARVSAYTSQTIAPKGGQSWLSYNVNVDVREGSSSGLTLYVFVTEFFTNGTVDLNGVETINITEAIEYSTVEIYTTLGSYGIKVSGEFTFYIYQLSWGQTIIKNDDGSFTWNSALKIGDGSTVVSVSDTLKQIYLSTFTTTQTYMIRVMDNATLTFGTLVDETNKAVKDGVQILSEPNILMKGESGSTVNIYASSILGGGSSSDEMWFVGTTRLWGIETNYMLKGIDLNLNDYHSFGSKIALLGVNTALSGTFNRITIYGADYILYAGYIEQTITISNLYARNCTYVYRTQWGNPTTIYLINPDIDDWSFFSLTGTTIYRQYTFDLITTTNSTIEISYYGQGGGTLFNATDLDGIIPTQTISKGFYNQTGGNTIYSYEPFHLKISKSGHVTYEANFTLVQKNFWQIELPLIIPIYYDPVARFNNTITTFHINENVFLNGSMSYDPDGGNIVDYSWNFGDDNTTSGNYPTITHKWSTANSYKINLTVTDDEATKNSFVWTINITNYLSPIARFTFSPNNPQPSLLVSFNASASSDPDGYITNYYWTFGDGYSYNSSSPTATHSFAAGIYQVTLKVTDNQGKTNTFTHLLTVVSTTTETTSGPSIEIYPDYDISFLPLPDYLLQVPIVSESFTTSLYLRNKGKFGKETQVTFWIEDENKEKIYEKAESLFVNALETQTIDVSLTKPSATGEYTLYAQITSQTRSKTVAQQAFQIYDILNWLIGPAIILLVIIIGVVIALIVVLYKKYVSW